MLCECSGSVVDARRAASALRGPCTPARRFPGRRRLVRCSPDGLFSLFAVQGCAHFDLGVSRARQKLLNRTSPSSSRTSQQHGGLRGFSC